MKEVETYSGESQVEKMGKEPLGHEKSRTNDIGRLSLQGCTFGSPINLYGET